MARTESLTHTMSCTLSVRTCSFMWMVGCGGLVLPCLPLCPCDWGIIVTTYFSCPRGWCAMQCLTLGTCVDQSLCVLTRHRHHNHTTTQQRNHAIRNNDNNNKRTVTSNSRTTTRTQRLVRLRACMLHACGRSAWKDTLYSSTTDRDRTTHTTTTTTSVHYEEFCFFGHGVVVVVVVVVVTYLALLLLSAWWWCPSAGDHARRQQEGQSGRQPVHPHHECRRRRIAGGKVGGRVSKKW